MPLGCNDCNFRYANIWYETLDHRYYMLDSGLECWSIGVMKNGLQVTGFYILRLAGFHILDFRMRIAEFNVLNI